LLSTYAEVFLLKSRAVIVGFSNAELVQMVVDHLVEKGIPSLGIGLVKVPPYINGWRVRKVTPVSGTSRDAYGDFFKDPTKEFLVELIPPDLERS
jgi:hypothetical protein